MPPPIHLSQIPTLSDLYNNGTLQPPSPTSDASLPTPSAILNAKVSLIRTSITNLATTCIVNAANTSLLGGGGVDGAIHAAAGPSLLRECRSLNGCQTGSAKITSAYDLPSSFIIHAVGPIYNRHRNVGEKLRGCYRKSLELGVGKGPGASIAFSCLSTGVYGYPSGEAAEVAVGEVRRFLEELEEEEGKEGRLERVVFCVFEEKDERAYGEWLPKIFPPTPADLPSKEEPSPETEAEAEEEDEAARAKPKPASEEGASATSTNTASEPQAKKLKTAAEEVDQDDWEPVEKPSEMGTDVGEEGVQVEAAEVGGKGEENVVERKEGTTAEGKQGTAAEGKGDMKAGGSQPLPENVLAKDW